MEWEWGSLHRYFDDGEGMNEEQFQKCCFRPKHPREKENMIGLLG